VFNLLSHTPTHISSLKARSLAAAFGVAAIVASLSAVSAFAEDPGVRCAAKVGTGQYEFYLPGERATDINGNKWVCGPDGQWFRDYSSIIVVSTTFTKASLISTTTYPVYKLQP
jgi:hypothetical protein